jgi:hypothetical protein
MKNGDFTITGNDSPQVSMAGSLKVDDQGLTLEHTFIEHRRLASYCSAENFYNMLQERYITTRQIFEN